MTDPIKKLKQLVEEWRLCHALYSTDGLQQHDVFRYCANSLSALLPELAYSIEDAVEAELETLKWLAPYLNDPDACEAAHERIAELEADHGKSGE